jgi:hypothetical protein
VLVWESLPRKPDDLLLPLGLLTFGRQDLRHVLPTQRAPRQVNERCCLDGLDLLFVAKCHDPEPVLLLRRSSRRPERVPSMPNSSMTRTVCSLFARSKRVGGDRSADTHGLRRTGGGIPTCLLFRLSVDNRAEQRNES